MPWFPQLRPARSLALPGAPLVGLLLAALLSPPIVAYEPLWEAAAAAGYAACCAIVLTFRLSPAPRVAVTPFRFSLHRAAGNAALALVAAHVLVMVALDPFVLDYLGWMMPLHVVAGLLGALALVLAVATREPVLRRALRLAGGPRLHAWAGIVAGALAALHVLTASSKLTTWWSSALIAVAFTAVLGPATWALVAPGQPQAGAAREKTSRPHPWSATRGDVAGLLAILGAIAALLVAVPSLVRALAS